MPQLRLSASSPPQTSALCVHRACIRCRRLSGVQYRPETRAGLTRTDYRALLFATGSACSLPLWARSSSTSRSSSVCRARPSTRLLVIDQTSKKEAKCDAYNAAMAGGQITIDRAARGWLNSARSYRVLIDGEAVTQVKYGKTVTVAAAPGRHELQLALDWTRSPKLQLDLTEGQELRVRCGPYGNPLMSLFRGIFTPRRSIVVELDSRQGVA